MTNFLIELVAAVVLMLVFGFAALLLYYRVSGDHVLTVHSDGRTHLQGPIPTPDEALTDRVYALRAAASHVHREVGDVLRAAQPNPNVDWSAEIRTVLRDGPPLTRDQWVRLALLATVAAATTPDRSTT